LKLTTDKHEASASLRQQSYLFSYITIRSNNAAQRNQQIIIITINSVRSPDKTGLGHE